MEKSEINHLLNMRNGIKPKASIIRQKAEDFLNKRNVGKAEKAEGCQDPVNLSTNQLSDSSILQQASPSAFKPLNLSEKEEVEKLLHEVEVYRIELEMQNNELKRALYEVETVATKYSNLYDFSPSGYYTLSRQGEIIETNLYGAEMLGKNRSHLQNSRFGFFVSDDTRSVFNNFLGKVFDSKVKESCEITLSIPDELPTHVYLTGLADPNGDQCLITAVDITLVRQAEKSLKEKEKKYRSVLENMQDVYYQIDNQGIIVEISPSIKDLSEFDSAELIGCQVERFYYKSDERTQFLNTIREKGAVNDFELQLKTKTGLIKVVSVNARLSLDNDGKPDHIDGSMRDITRRKQAEENVRKLQKAIENAKVSVVITDNDGLIEFANPFFSELTGYTQKEYIGQNPRVLKSGYHSREFYQSFWNTIKSGQTWEGEFYNRKKNGELYWEKAVISPIYNETNKISHFVAIKTDITPIKIINEELLKAKEKAEENDNLKTAFLNNISHEIRTPFNGILGFLSILQNDDLTTSERKEYTDIINESAFRLMNTINDITELSQIQTGQIRLNKSDFSIPWVIEEVIDLFKTDAKMKGLILTVRNELPEKVTNIFTDRLKLIRILNKLLSNAVKFTKEGSVELAIRLKDTGYDISNCTELEFSITDTGIGIPENKLQTIFEPFIQADSSNTRQFEGSGLGTTIAKAFAEMLGGTIGVESKLGVGSVFRFTIPYQTEYKDNIILNNSSSNGPEKKPELLKILLAEDDEASSMLLSIIIKTLYRELLIVRTGVEAVETCRDNPDIDLVLMDIRMPDMDGYTATRQIRQFNPEVVIIAQTAHALTSDREEALNSGCNDFILKPIQKEKIVELIQKKLNRNGEFNQ